MTRAFYHLKATPLSQEQRSLISGCLLGQGALLRSEKGCRFTCGHLTEEAGLLEWKMQQLHNFTNFSVANKTKPARFFRTVVHHELNPFLELHFQNNRRRVPPNIVEIADPLMLTTWATDVGWIQDERFYLATLGFVDEECELLRCVLKRFGIKAMTEPGLLLLDSESSAGFQSLIKQNLQWTVRTKPPASNRLWS